MKNLTYLVLIIGSLQACNTNNELELAALSNEAIFTKVDQQPTFPGGATAYYNYVKTNLIYPQKAKDNKIEGKVFIQFIVNKTGKIESPTILKGIGYGCDSAALDIVKHSADWIAGSQKDIQVNVRMVLPIIFKLD